MKDPVPGVHQVLSGYVNAYCLRSQDGLVLIDTGTAKSEGRILRAVAEIGHTPADIKHIIITHAHPDHMGSLAALVELTGAQCWAHEIDAGLIETGTLPPIHPGPGMLAKLLYLSSRVMPNNVAPAKVDHWVRHGDSLPGGLVAIHAPGHSPGQIALMLAGQQLLFAADAMMNIWGLKLSLVNENQAQAALSAAKLASLDFDRALFGHGKPILGNAARKFREAFPAS